MLIIQFFWCAIVDLALGILTIVQLARLSAAQLRYYSGRPLNEWVLQHGAGEVSRAVRILTSPGGWLLSALLFLLLPLLAVVLACLAPSRHALLRPKET